MSPCNPSKPRRALLSRSLTAFSLGGALLSAGCATAPQRPQIPLPDSFRQACSGPATEGVATVGDLAAFSIRQEVALQVCDARRAGAVAVIDAANVRAKPRKWWPF